MSHVLALTGKSNRTRLTESTRLMRGARTATAKYLPELRTEGIFSHEKFCVDCGGNSPLSECDCHVMLTDSRWRLLLQERGKARW